MKRRDFFKMSLMGLGFGVVAKATGFLSEALAAVTFVAPGKLGYKEAAPANQVAAGKQCKTCKHYRADGKAGKDAGMCALPAMKGGYVKAEGYCNMWMKKA